MAQNVPDFYTGFTQVEVEEMLATYKAELKNVLASYSTTGDSVTKIRRDELFDLIKGCQRALKRFDPDTYGRSYRAVISRVDNLPK